VPSTFQKTNVSRDVCVLETTETPVFMSLKYWMGVVLSCCSLFWWAARAVLVLLPLVLKGNALGHEIEYPMAVGFTAAWQPRPNSVCLSCCRSMPPSAIPRMKVHAKGIIFLPVYGSKNDITVI
jgi:hypothetical protein